MAKTLLNAVNDIFRLAELISGDANALTSLTDSARQGDIDTSIMAFNQVIDELYTSAGISNYSQQAQDTITIATGTRNYTLHTNLVRLHWPLIDKTRGTYIYEFEEGYDALLELDPEITSTGTPVFGCISPVDGSVYLFPTPTSADNGHVYTYQYDKDLGMSLAADTVPFNETIYRAVIPAAFQIWKRERRGAFDGAIFKTHFGRAARLLSSQVPDDDYSPR